MTNLSPELYNKLSQCLCPPGDGVFTVNTAKERKQVLQQALYGTTKDVRALWQSSLQSLPLSANAVILGIASDCGGGILRGANWGPLFLRSTMLEQQLSANAFDLGDIRVIPHLLHDKYLNEATIANCRKALYQDEHSTYPVSPLSITEDILHDFYRAFPNKGVFAIGGDHSISYPLTKAYLQAKKAQGKKTAIIHFDAHTDLLVERLGIDLCFGSWCTHILGDLHDNSHLIQLGIRSSGKPKTHWEATFGVKQYWAEEIRQQSAQQIVTEIIDHLKQQGIEELYVSFDIDAIDDTYAAATGTPEPNGLYPQEAMDILTALAAEFAITGADMMEIAPFTDSSGQGQASRDKTLQVASEISGFLLGEMAK